MLKRKIKYFFAAILTIVSLCGFGTCDPVEDEGNLTPVPLTEKDCLDYFQYKARVNLADTVKGYVFYKNELIYSNNKNYCYSCEYSWGPTLNLKIFDTLSIKFSVFCNDQWLESRDYKFLNRKDAFTHIDYKEQLEGELMFDAELDSICPGLSNYRITQYTDTECLEELNSK